MTDALAPEIILNFIRNKTYFFIGVDAVGLGLGLLDALFDALKNIIGLLGFDCTTAQYLLNISTLRRAEGVFFAPNPFLSWKTIKPSDIRPIPDPP